jgi:hypothetical protein
MCLFDDHYVWNYWEPFGVWDIEDASRNKLRHWVNVHPYRNYQSGEIHEIAEAYHSGLTFDQQDIQRIINTNINVMWNGDRQNPEWRNSNYAVEKAALGKEPAEKKPGEDRAGTLWHGLLDFSETVRSLAKYTSDTPVSFQRQYADLPVTVFERPFHSNKYLNLCAAMPCVIKQGQTSQLVSQSRISGQITIDLYTRDGKTKVKTLRNDPQKKDYVGVLLVPWQTNETVPGEYLVRWSIRGESRDFAVRVE